MMLTSRIANSWTVSLKSSTFGDYHHTVKYSWCPVQKQFIHSIVVQILALFQLTVSVQKESVGVNLPRCRSPAHWQVSCASYDCDSRNRCWFCTKNKKSRHRPFQKWVRLGHNRHNCNILMYSMCNQYLSAVISVTSCFKGSPAVLRMKRGRRDLWILHKQWQQGLQTLENVKQCRFRNF